MSVHLGTSPDIGNQCPSKSIILIFVLIFGRPPGAGNRLRRGLTSRWHGVLGVYAALGPPMSHTSVAVDGTPVVTTSCCPRSSVVQEDAGPPAKLKQPLTNQPLVGDGLRCARLRVAPTAHGEGEVQQPGTVVLG